MNGRFRYLSVLLLLALPACGTGPSAETGASPDEAVRDSVIALMDRLNDAATQKDLDSFMALWERSDSLVYTRSGLTFIGWDEIAANHRGAFSAPGEWSFEPAEIHVVVLGPRAATATAFIRSASYGPEGTENRGWFTITIAVQASEAGWRIVQAHGSYPESGNTPRGEPDL